MDKERAEAAADEMLEPKLRQQQARSEHLNRKMRPPRLGMRAALFTVVGFGIGAAIGYFTNGHWLTAAVFFSGMGALYGARRDGQA